MKTLETFKQELLDILKQPNSESDDAWKQEQVSALFTEYGDITKDVEIQAFLRDWSDTITLIYQLGLQWSVIPDTLACAVEVIENPVYVYTPNKTLYPFKTILLMLSFQKAVYQIL